MQRIGHNIFTNLTLPLPAVMNKTVTLNYQSINQSKI